VFWVVPVLVLALSVGIQACGGSDDDDDCSETVEFATEAQCEVFAESFDCDGYSYADDGVCEVFGCICEIFDDDDFDDDDDVF
jgi:hypothetical protein